MWKSGYYSSHNCFLFSSKMNQFRENALGEKVVSLFFSMATAMKWGACNIIFNKSVGIFPDVTMTNNECNNCLKCLFLQIPLMLNVPLKTDICRKIADTTHDSNPDKYIYYGSKVCCHKENTLYSDKCM